MRRAVPVAGIAALTVACWLALAAWPAGLTVCGAGGIVRLIPVWDLGHALSLLAMWAVMSAAMMLPCAAIGIAGGRAGVAPALTRTFRQAVSIAIVVAPAQWLLQSLGAMDDGLLPGGAAMQAILLVIAGTAAALHLGARLCGAASVAMVSLQLAGGAMTLGWMLVVAVCMVALSLPSACKSPGPAANATLIKSSRLIQTG